jgi:hypothetical protein
MNLRIYQDALRETARQDHKGKKTLAQVYGNAAVGASVPNTVTTSIVGSSPKME